MKAAIAALILTTTTAMAQAPGVTITVPEEMVKKCQEEDGCKLLSMHDVYRVYLQGQKEGQRMCRSSI